MPWLCSSLLTFFPIGFAVSYMRNNLLTSGIGSLLGSGGEDVLHRGSRDARSRYMEVWQELIALLAESTNTGAVARFTGASGDKQLVKDSLSNFFARLDELEGISRQHSLSRQDPNLRERLTQDVRNLVTPAFSSYANRHPKNVSKCKSFRHCLLSHADLYLHGLDARSTPAEIEHRITSMII